MKQDVILSTVGLAFRAQKAILGEERLLQGIRTGNVSLVLVATDASEATKEKYRNKCKYYQLPCLEYADKATLSYSVGRDHLAAIGICDEGFSQRLQQLIKNVGGDRKW